ncbi:MAG TPA: hypothetical protein VMY18_04020 [Acidobacteriota bacterium]|nr:hypothetical protein [Acidobacteriota bacterium]
MKKWLVRFLIVVLVAFGALLLYLYSNIRDRHPGYELDLHIRSESPGPLRIGFSAVPITPEIQDTWVDSDGDAYYDESKGDHYVDGNGNGKFDPFWLAGFQNRRPANGVHDDLWARTVVIDDGQTKIALVVLDVIGFFHDDIVDVRTLIPESSGINYTIVASTHNHEAPDLLGLWGSSHFQSGVNQDYLASIKQKAAQSVVEAAAGLRPARLRISQDLQGARELLNDTRLPHVFDPGLRCIQAIDAETDETLGVLVSWADHPETLWSRNLLITSDFPHFLRSALENGIDQGGQLVHAGLGGTAIYVNGAIGGLMTTDDDLAVSDPFSDEVFVKPSFEKARAQGHQLALLVLKSLESAEAEIIEEGGIHLRAKTIDVALDNILFRVGATLGVIDRGFSGWMTIRSEVAAFTLGDLSFLCAPGEIYPEIVEGGIEAPEGGDFGIEPVEVPALRSQMPGKYKFVLGMANDEIGYIIPKSEWDEDPPFLYGAAKSPYGEINSPGPQTGPVLHRELLEILSDLD